MDPRGTAGYCSIGVSSINTLIFLASPFPLFSILNVLRFVSVCKYAINNAERSSERLSSSSSSCRFPMLWLFLKENTANRNEHAEIITAKTLKISLIVISPSQVQSFFQDYVPAIVEGAGQFCGVQFIQLGLFEQGFCARGNGGRIWRGIGGKEVFFCNSRGWGYTGAKTEECGRAGWCLNGRRPGVGGGVFRLLGNAVWITGNLLIQEAKR